MKVFAIRFTLVAFVSLSLLFVGMISFAADSHGASVAMPAGLQQWMARYQKMSALQRMFLSSSDRRMLHLAQSWEHVSSLVKAEPLSATALRTTVPENRVAQSPDEPSAPASLPIAVSNPATDFDYSAFAGFEQNTTSAAWCGSHVVVGFNDTGSIFEAMAVTGTRDVSSISGWANSADAGKTFIDRGYMLFGSDSRNVAKGQPSVACSDENTFYYLQTFVDVTANATGLSISKSTDGGATFGEPSLIAGDPNGMFFVGTGKIGVDPSNHQHVVVTYDQSTFDTSDCPQASGSDIMVIDSRDAGAHWSSPQSVAHVCSNNELIGNSHLAIGSAGDVHLAWRDSNFDGGTAVHQIRTLALGSGRKQAIVDQIFVIGSSSALQGGLVQPITFDLAIDSSRGDADGTLYLTWSDGRNRTIADAVTGSYSFADVMARVSTDGGQTWRGPVVINLDGQPRGERGQDHFSPAVGVDKNGVAAICWYDRRQDPENFAIGRWCASSHDRGTSWTNFAIHSAAFPPIVGLDFLGQFEVDGNANVGDYDSVVTDFLQQAPGFVGTFEVMSSRTNPDVVAVRLHR